VFSKSVLYNGYEQYYKSLEELYKAVSMVTEKPVLVDSSKNPLRGNVLLNIFKNNMYFIHLIRDGRGTMWSWVKSGEIPPFGVSIRKKPVDWDRGKKEFSWWLPWVYSLSWMSYNLISSFVIWKAGHKRSIRIQYENFLKEPSYYIKRISELIKEDLSDLENLVTSKKPLIIDHLIAGNRLRMSKQIYMRSPDEEWKSKLFRDYKRIFWLINGWLARLYGYKVSS